MRKATLLTLLSLCLTWACQKDSTEVLDGEIFIRIDNTSKFKYNNIKVILSEERIYGDLAPGEKSVYLPFSKAYRYAYVELKIGGKRFLIQPIDFIGGEELTAGKYTYLISADDSSNKYGRLNLVFRMD